MTIETKRLLLCPLQRPGPDALMASDLARFEREWDCHYEGEPVEGTFREIVQQQWKITSMDERNYLFHSFWLLLRKADRTVVGAADFKAPPNARGEVEIGYGLGGAHERRGYMTEAVDALVRLGASAGGCGERFGRNGTQEPPFTECPAALPVCAGARRPHPLVEAEKIGYARRMPR